MTSQILAIIGVSILILTPTFAVAKQDGVAPQGSRDVPHWVRAPSGQDLDHFYPARAKREGVSGRSTMRCSSDSDGNLSACKTVPDSEAPDGYGFAESTLKTAPLFRLASPKPMAGGTIEIPIVWRRGPNSVVPMSPLQEKARISILKAAFDPAAQPPLIEPIYAKIDPKFAVLAPIGPYFPDRAARNGVAGAAAITCTVAGDHTFAPCTKLAEVPEGFSFDDAALRMAKAGYITAPRDIAIGSVVRVLVKYPKPTKP